MSQLQVTGEAKIRDIQGPVVANSGVITALDGAANQYVRGDGTLAIFPSSSGGGSSVSYYLNGSVNQGTFGGSTYYQMSRNAIVGTGTNFSTSSDGLIAQFITDANDPDVVSIPSGNWNVEFFMNVSASSGALASFYVEIYKYNGSTFTLLATNVATPEQLTNTTTVDAYFTSVAMPLSAMAVTDRLAVRIFANVASKTVTLYTEDNRLCQIVTTFSNGLTSLNNLTDQSQYLTTGTSGTDFNIVSSGDTHTFNIPSASASNRGLITTGSQTIAGAKVFDTPITANSGIGFLNGVMPNITSNLYTGIGGNSEGISIITRPFSTNYTNNLYFGLNNNSYTFPDATGTIALTSDLNSYVPYSGATTNVNLGAYSLTANQLIAGGANIDNVATFSTYDQGHALKLKGSTGDLFFVPYFSPSIGARITAQNSAASANTPLSFYASNFYFNSNVNFGSTLGNGTYTYTLPSATGTLALTSNLSAYLPLTGGTLTGALSGTSATFSGNMAIGGTTITDANMLNVIGNQSSVNIGLVLNNTNATYPKIYAIQNVNNNLVFYDYSASATRLTISNTGAATFSSGIGIGGATATTGGIQFPTTEVNVNNANNLDDYEEGSFTPVVVGSSTAGTATYSAQNGRYVKIGRAVNFNLYCDWSAGTGTGSLYIGGLPYVADAAGIYPACAIGETSGITLAATGIMTARVQISTTLIFLSQYPLGGGSSSAVSYDGAGYVVLAGTYYV